MLLDVQLSLPSLSWDEVRDASLQAEAAGFATLWTWDHFAGTVFGGDQLLECFTQLGALAAATTTIGLGSLVANVVNRHPGLLAHCAASVQAISGGRLWLGLGAGAAPGSRFAAEHDALGIELAPTMAARHERLLAQLDLLDEVWAVDRDDRWNGFARPAVRPPTLLGVNSVRLARLAGARTNGVNVRANHDRLGELLDAAQQARAAAVEDGSAAAGPWTTSVWARWDRSLLDPDDPQRRRFAALGVDRLVLVCLSPDEVRDVGEVREVGAPAR